MQQKPLGLADAFSRVVENERETQKLSRAALAAKAGLHQTYVGLMERGKRTPNLATAEAISAALGFPLSKLLTRAEKLKHQK